MPVRLETRAEDFETRFARFLGTEREVDRAVEDTVAHILADVRANGDAAIITYTRDLDGLTLTPETLSIDAGEIESAAERCAEDAVEALCFAAARIRDYHRRQLPEDLDVTDDLGVRLGHRWTPIRSVGMYVPGGTAAYPSSVLMNALPARVAGVERLVMAVPTPGGELNPLVLAAAHIAGVDQVYRIGGAQAVAALAYGTETIEPVDKIVGPGNAYVAAAKRRVFGVVGIDLIAGPSEILVIADGANDPAWIAADLLSQAEHDTAARAVLITDDAAFAERVERAIAGHLAALPRADTAGESWQRHGAVIVVRDFDEAVAIVDRIAPEHLEVALALPEPFARKVRNAGAIFLGRHTPEAVGDYVGGPNHVLPTGGSARFSSGLGVLDFLKRTSLLACTDAGLAALGPAAATLARAEGLDAHALSIDIRLGRRP